MYIICFENTSKNSSIYLSIYWLTLLAFDALLVRI